MVGSGQEPHAGEGYHFHAALYLAKTQRFAKPLKWLQAKGINVHFSEGLGDGVSSQEQFRGYWGALEYISKVDTAVAKSSDHPSEIPDVARTAAAISARRERCRERKRSRFIADAAGEGDGQCSQGRSKCQDVSGNTL